MTISHPAPPPSHRPSTTASHRARRPPRVVRARSITDGCRGGAVLAMAFLGIFLAAGVAAAAPPHWTWPLSPRPEVVRPFDPPDSPWSRGHRGVDLLGAVDQQVRSAGAGVITYAGLLAGRGVITVQHGQLRTTYEPVAAAVAVGDPVNPGTVLGTLQAAGGHCAPRICLHWGLLRGSDYLDPLSLVGGGPPRLLPLGSASTTDLALPAVSYGPGDRATPGPGANVAAPSGSDSAASGSDSTVTGSDSAVTGSIVAASGRATPATDVPTPAGAEGSPPTPASGGAEPSRTDEPSRGPSWRAAGLPTMLTTFSAPAAGAIAGAVVAGFLIRRSGSVTSPTDPPPRPPGPPLPNPPRPRGASRPGAPRQGRTEEVVIDLAAERRRFRGAA
ncbi:murein hydrolase activator EnvC family protein [Actinopolymorpha pittospori]|uniref:M23ase beta-sheet core domain-containing protein n=1 Tax=Actinopolymorpha pittospori TaxID=648752 RepID=A0A927N364_9ACTN|nr:M23 family metallopeptidase [Actinopolymorpha pittospori]MBE1611289.1 hypothetical protein [Actinopolymorpha pittospori]